MRSAVAIVTIATLLFCQALWASQVHAVYSVASAGVSGSGCHAAIGDEQPEHATPTPCDSAQVSSDTFQSPSLAFAMLPTLAFSSVETRRASQSGAISSAPRAGAPPPRLLYCRFLN